MVGNLSFKEQSPSAFLWAKRYLDSAPFNGRFHTLRSLTVKDVKREKEKRYKAVYVHDADERVKGETCYLYPSSVTWTSGQWKPFSQTRPSAMDAHK